MLLKLDTRMRNMGTYDLYEALRGQVGPRRPSFGSSLAVTAGL